MDEINKWLTSHNVGFSYDEDTQTTTYEAYDVAESQRSELQSIIDQQGKSQVVSGVVH